MKKHLVIILFCYLVLFNACDSPGGGNEDLTGPPVSGGEGEITVEDIQAESVLISWENALDDATVAEELEYKAVYSMQYNIATVEAAELFGTAGIDWTAGITSCEVKGLYSLTDYFINVMVRDEDGNMSAYKTVPVTTGNYISSASLTITIMPDMGVHDVFLIFDFSNGLSEAGYAILSFPEDETNGNFIPGHHEYTNQFNYHESYYVLLYDPADRLYMQKNPGGTPATKGVFEAGDVLSWKLYVSNITGVFEITNVNIIARDVNGNPVASGASVVLNVQKDSELAP